MPKIGLPEFLISSCCQNYLFDITPEQRMVSTAPLKKSPYMKEWMAQAEHPKEAITVRN